MKKMMGTSAVLILVLMVIAITGCTQQLKETKKLVPDQAEQTPPSTLVPPQEEPNEVVEDINTYEGADIDLEEFDDLTEDFEGL